MLGARGTRTVTRYMTVSQQRYDVACESDDGISGIIFTLVYEMTRIDE